MRIYSLYFFESVSISASYFQMFILSEDGVASPLAILSHIFLASSPERLRNLIDDCVEAGQKSGRFILCPSAGYMEYPQPSEQYINNLMFYLKYGLEAVERYAK